MRAECAKKVKLYTPFLAETHVRSYVENVWLVHLPIGASKVRKRNMQETEFLTHLIQTEEPREKTQQTDRHIM